MTIPHLDPDERDPDELDPDERDLEAPDADAAEQATPADPREGVDEAAPTSQVHHGLDVEREVNEWDAVEQARAVPLDDEDR